MSEKPSGKPPAPDLPKYLREPLEKQSPERLEMVATYARDLADWKRQQRQDDLERRRAEEEVDEEQLAELEDREVSTDPADYDDVPATGAYITVKTTKRTSQKEYRYFYWQWREGDSWKNQYIAPVTPGENS
jgi:hypothetical protein